MVGMVARAKVGGNPVNQTETTSVHFRAKLGGAYTSLSVAGIMVLLSGWLFSSISPGATTRYVNLNNPAPVSPFTNWATAAVTIQAAVDAAVDGDLILVTNGVYATGARKVYAMSNRVAVARAVRVQSVNGPGVTVIRGYRMPSTTNGFMAIRCVYLTNGAVLAGFTLTNGATQASGDINRQRSGGGVWCESAAAIVTNCILCGNSAYQGGGAYSGTFNRCTLTANVGYSGGGANASALYDCTLRGNSASTGGGATGGTLVGCELVDNSATGTGDGGGVASGAVFSSTLTGNSACYGGGASGGSLNHCTVAGNRAIASGGGTYRASLTNCIVCYNSARDGNYDLYSSLSYCCTSPLPGFGDGNFDIDPQLVNSSHLSAASPCRGAGAPVHGAGRDIDGQPWAYPPSIGCDEYWSGSVTGDLAAVIVAEYTNVVAGFDVNFQAIISGQVSNSGWDFGDAGVVANRPFTTHQWAKPGEYPVVLHVYNEGYPLGIEAMVIVHVVDRPVHYVSLDSIGPVAPYSTWATAATNIQDAVDASSVAGALIMVSNGVYGFGARQVNGMSNRLAVTRAMEVRSLSGPLNTSIEGYQVPGTTNGANAVRCVFLADRAVLSGFVLTNGATQISGDLNRQQSGGGVWCDAANTIVSNCTLIGNSAAGYGGASFRGALDRCTLRANSTQISGGGAYLGTLANCILDANSAGSGGGAHSCSITNCQIRTNSAYSGGGASFSTLYGCSLTGNSAHVGGGTDESTLNWCSLVANAASAYSGGASFCTLNNCILTGNWATFNGGGASDSVLSGCNVSGNSASSLGGGVCSCILTNCTLVGNSASYGGGAYWGPLKNCTVVSNFATISGGGSCGASLGNCILFYNSAPDGNYDALSTLSYCCTIPLPTAGIANFTNAPRFLDPAGSDFRLQELSPCINAGLNFYAPEPVDLDGNHRISGGTVDVGAYEFSSPASQISYAWLQQYGLAIDSATDAADPDLDGMSNWQEWIAGTDPTSAASALRLLSVSIAPGTVSLSWASVTNRTYSVERATNLRSSPAFSLVQSNLVGGAGTTVLSDTNVEGAGPFFYRVRVEE